MSSVNKLRKKIVVSSLGAKALLDVPKNNQEAVELMIAHWRDELSYVLPNKPDLIVLPEASDRFPKMSMAERLEYYRFRGDKILNFFREVAKENSCYIAYSAAREMSDKSFRNSTQLIDRKGNVVEVYNKNYLVPAETTLGGILAGKEEKVFDTDFGRVAFAICFDLNFHELLERYAKRKVDLIIFSSMYHGGLMQNYWAYHCRSYFIGTIAGLENNIINPLGNVIAKSTNYLPRITTEINLDYQVVHLDENWDKIKELKSKYGRDVTIFDPDYLGAILVTSEHPTVSSIDMINEFEIELWDDYYKRGLNHRIEAMEV